MVETALPDIQTSYQNADEHDAINPCQDINDRTQLFPQNKASPRKKRFWKVRYNLIILGNLAGLLAYCLRFDLSMALVLMVNQTSSENDHGHNKSYNSYCPGSLNETVMKNTTPVSGNINWDSKKQGIITSAFFVGYFLSQCPWGFMAQRMGGKIVVGYSLLCCALLTFVFPSACKYNFILAVIIRGLMGIAQGGVFPGLILLQGKWAPVSERSTFNTVIGTGALLGIIVSTYSPSLLSKIPHFGGWEISFYVFGAATFVWYIFWHSFMFNDPKEHTWISSQEREYIQQSLNSSKSHDGDIPWKSILTYIPFWSVIFMLFCSSWLFYSTTSFLPSYMKNILGLGIKQNGEFSTYPYIAALIMSTVSGIVADMLINRGVNITLVRKIFATTGLLTESICMMSFVYLGCQKNTVEAILIIAYGCAAISDGGTSVTVIDIAPKYAGVIYGLANSVTNLSGVLGPMVTGAIVTEENSLNQWKTAFWVGCIINVLGVLNFICFGSAKKASWAKETDTVINTDPNDIQKHYGAIKS